MLYTAISCLRKKRTFWMGEKISFFYINMFQNPGKETEHENKMDCIKKNTIIQKNLLKYMDESAILRELWHDSVEA